MIKAFSGLLDDGEQDTIRLSTNNGLIGYRIVKFQLMANAPGASNYESIVKLYKREQSSVDAIVDFDDSALIGSAYLEGSDNYAYVDAVTVVFDQEIFNQDIYITHSEIKGSAACNYYLELEQVALDVGEAAVATLKDMRGTN